MNYIKTIKNIHSEDLNFDNLILSSGTSFIIDDNLKLSKNYNSISVYFSQNKLEVYNEENVIISDGQLFSKIWNFWRIDYLEKEKHPNYYKIYDFLTHDALIGKNYDYSLAPHSVDYVRDVNIRFVRKETFTRGFLTNVEYYESSTTGANGVTYYINPILNVNMEYFVDDKGYVYQRNTKRKWVQKDNIYSSEIKITQKSYNGVMSREEAIQRRNNIINQLVIDIVTIVYMNNYLTKTFDEVELMVLPLLDSLDNETNKYLKGNLQPLIEGITNADTTVHTWLEIIVEGSTTLQDYIENKLIEAILAEGTYTSTEPS